MLSHVNNAIRVLSECFATEIAAEGFFPGVNSGMHNQMVL